VFLLSSIFVSISLNEKYLNQLYIDILDVLTINNPKTFKVWLKLSDEWVALWYLTCIVYSIQTYEASNLNHPLYGMVHRTQTERSLKIINFVIIYLQIDEKIETKMLKMIMSLNDKHFYSKKILI